MHLKAHKSVNNIVKHIEGKTMTDKSMMHQGKSLAQWEKDFKGEFTADQLEKMARGGADLQKV